MSNEEEVSAIILAAYLLENEEDDKKNEPPKKRRRMWVKNWVARHYQEGFCAKLCAELRTDEPKLYYNFMRMTPQQFEELLSLVSPLITKKDTVMRKSISASDRLVLTLRFLATGESYHSLQYLFRIPFNTIASIVPEVLDAIYKVLSEKYLQVPRTPEAWEAIARDFNDLWQFPNCIGAVDGKHVTMFSPAHSGSVFFNYKKTYSIILMGIADAKYNLIYVDVGRNGKFSDGGVFNRCSFARAMDTNKLGLPSPKPLPGRTLPMPYTLVADDAFSLRENLMKPYAQQGLGMVDRVYNYRLSRARRNIENVFGIMVVRFRILLQPINLNAEKTKKVVLACCVLHNFLMATNDRSYASPNAFDRYGDNGEFLPGSWRNETGSSSTMFPLEPEENATVPSSAKEVQNELASYFVEEGEIKWQYDRI